jgi:hypothetical protein
MHQKDKYVIRQWLQPILGARETIFVRTKNFSRALNSASAAHLTVHQPRQTNVQKQRFFTENAFIAAYDALGSS